MATMVTTKKVSGRQWPLVASIVINYGDIPATATAYEAIDLPAGARVTGGFIKVENVWADSTTATMDLGDSGTATRYATAANLETANGYTAVVPTGYVYTVPSTIDVTTAFGSADSAVGSVIVVVEYVVDDRATEVGG